VRRLRQVHGSQVVVVDRAPPPGARRWVAPAPGDPPEGDAVVASDDTWVLAVLTADCAPVALGSPEGVHAAVHVGWRGIVAGVVPHAVKAMTSLGTSTVVAAVGPCIGPCCYEFSARDLDVVTRTAGTGARSRTTAGQLSLDLPAAVRGQLVASGAVVVAEADTCTACTSGHFSYRARGDEARQALLVWRERASA
jgi:YfiH family protein